MLSSRMAEDMALLVSPENINDYFTVIKAMSGSPWKSPVSPDSLFLFLTLVCKSHQFAYINSQVPALTRYILLQICLFPTNICLPTVSPSTCLLVISLSLARAVLSHNSAGPSTTLWISLALHTSFL